MEQLPTILTIVFGLGALGYLASIHKLPFKGDFALKAIPALTLAVAAILLIPGIHGKLLCAGFVLSALGDISLSFKGEKFFLGGLVSFLLAHVVYIFTFANGSAWAMDKAWLLGVLAVFGVAMLILLTPSLGPMKIPVYVYISVILTMDAMAVLRGGNNGLLIAGALTFTLSDSILAWDRFKQPLSWGKYGVMSTYYAGQAMICLAFLCPTLGSCALN
jgi:alkenylglycerophosphocholine hydrolase